MLTSGYVFLFDEMVVFWSSKMHYCVADSTIETEYVSCNTTVSKAVENKSFVVEFKFKYT